MHPEVDAAVFETARGGVLREGLAFDRRDVAVVTNIGAGDHLGLNYITTVEDLAVVKRVIVQNVAPSGMAVLNAADPSVVAMAASCPGGVTFFARDRNHPVMATHRAQGHRIVYLEDGQSSPPRAKMRHRIALTEIPSPKAGALVSGGKRHGRRRRRLGAGPEWPVVHAGLASFINDAATAPGRFNTFNYQGAMVIADYGHNPDAMLALVQAIDNLPSERRSVVISGAGDRRDQDIRDQTRILGAAFDSVILYQTPANAAAPTAKCSPRCAKACKTPRAPATAKKSRANSTPSTARWPN